MTGRGLILLGVPLLVFLGLLVGPLVLMVVESFRVYEPGGIGSVTGAAFTLENYRTLVHPGYGLYFLDTFRIDFLTTCAGLKLSHPPL